MRTRATSSSAAVEDVESSRAATDRAGDHSTSGGRPWPQRPANGHAFAVAAVREDSVRRGGPPGAYRALPRARVDGEPRGVSSRAGRLVECAHWKPHRLAISRDG